MRRWLICCLLLACCRLAAPPGLEAQAPAAPAPTASAAPAGSKPTITLGGLLQVQAEASDRGDARFGTDNDRFYLRRARLSVNGRFLRGRETLRCEARAAMLEPEVQDMRFLLAGATLLVMIGGGVPAAGCSCGVESGGRFLVPAQAEVPANAAGVPWFGALDVPSSRVGAAPEGTFRVRELSGNGAAAAAARVEVLRQGPLPTTWHGRGVIALVSPAGGFRPGARYELEYLPLSLPLEQSWRQGKPHRVEVTVSRESLAPREAGTEVAVVDHGVAPLEVSTLQGSCSLGVIAHQIGVELRLPPELEQWRSALLFATRVDGEDWRPANSYCEIVPPGRSWRGTGADLAFTACRPAPLDSPEPDPAMPGAHFEYEESLDPRTAPAPELNLPEGDRLVEMTGWLPGTDVVLRGSARIRLGCPPAGEPASAAPPARPSS